MDFQKIQEIRGLFLFEMLSDEETEEAMKFFYEKMYASGMKVFAENKKAYFDFSQLRGS